MAATQEIWNESYMKPSWEAVYSSTVKHCVCDYIITISFRKLKWEWREMKKYVAKPDRKAEETVQWNDTAIWYESYCSDLYFSIIQSISFNESILVNLVYATMEVEHMGVPAGSLLGLPGVRMIIQRMVREQNMRILERYTCRARSCDACWAWCRPNILCLRCLPCVLYVIKVLYFCTVRSDDIPSFYRAFLFLLCILCCSCIVPCTFLHACVFTYACLLPRLLFCLFVPALRCWSIYIIPFMEHYHHFLPCCSGTMTPCIRIFYQHS